MGLVYDLEDYSRASGEWHTLEELALGVDATVDDVRDCVVRCVYPRCYGLGTDATWDERRVLRDGHLKRAYRVK